MKLDGGKLGVMGFNNMILVIPSCLIPFDIQKETDEKYRQLLLNQLAYCNKNRDIILHRAETTYQKVKSGKVPHYRKVCCNFEKTERKCQKYDPEFFKKKKAKATIPGDKAPR